eukprot:128866-Amphidinium_carterae.1
MAETPEGAQDVEGAELRPEKRARGRTRKSESDEHCGQFAETQSAICGTASATAVSGTAGSATASASGADGSGVASGPAPEAVRSSTIRVAEMLEEADQEAHKFMRLDDETVSTLYRSERISIVGEIADVAVAVPMEKNHLDYSHSFMPENSTYNSCLKPCVAVSFDPRF